MMRQAFLISVALALLAAGSARAQYDEDLARTMGVSCRPLVELIAKEVENSGFYVQSSRDTSGYSDDLLGVINIVPARFMSGAFEARVACWRQLRGGEPDATTMDAVFAASRVQLRHLDFLIGRKEQVYFSDLQDTFQVERSTGVFGPVSVYLRKRGLADLTDEAEGLRYSFNGAEFAELPYPARLEDALGQLAALCLAHPVGYRAYIKSLSYPDALLELHPSRLVPQNPDDRDGDYRAYLDSERDRIVHDCPA